jgi:hypothetical protein
MPLRRSDQDCWLASEIPSKTKVTAITDVAHESIFRSNTARNMQHIVGEDLPTATFGSAVVSRQNLASGAAPLKIL